MTDLRDVSFEGKRMLVCGGGGTGMGSAVVSALSARGAEVHVLDIADPTVDVVGFRKTDLGDRSDIDDAVDSLGGSWSGLVNCQGISGKGPGSTPEDVMRINFLGVRHVTDQVLPRLNAGASIVSIASAGGLGWAARLGVVTAIVETPDLEAGLAWIRSNPKVDYGYALSKECVIVWTMRRAAELARRGVRVNCTSPGATATPMKQEFRSSSVDFMIQPIGRVSTIEEQAAPITFLASDAASYVSGVNLIVDGGHSAAESAGLI